MRGKVDPAQEERVLQAGSGPHMRASNTSAAESNPRMSVNLDAKVLGVLRVGRIG